MHRLFFLILLGLLLVTPVMGQDAVSDEPPEISGHYLNVTIEPDDNYILVYDIVTLAYPYEGWYTFTLNKNLNVSRVLCDSSPMIHEIMPYEGEGTGETCETETFHNVRIYLPEGSTEFHILYDGRITDPIDPSGALGRIRGDYTSGDISPDGVYLSSGTGWYPDTEYSMAKYNMSVMLPQNWHAVTQGDLMGSIDDGYNTMSFWSGEIPSDGCVLVANEYFIRSRTIGDVECSTYFYQDDTELSDSFLDGLDEYLPVYEDLYGPLPYSRFDIAENFFTTGYGMPAFTLLGSRVLRMPYATAEGSLAHELVHNWWGNGVHVAWEKGNWCEGLTSFSTNYYWHVLDGRPDDAKHYRFRSMVRFSVEVSEEEQYPVREFYTKMAIEDGMIGYDKAGAFFILLKYMIGDEDFFDALRIAVERYTGHRTTWDDFLVVFEEVSGRDLSNYFSSWLDNPGAPELRFEDIEQVEGEDGWHLSFNVIQDGDIFYCDVPLVIHLADQDFETSFELFAQEQECEWLLDSPADSFEIDPDYYMFRRLKRAETPPSLNTTLDADSLLIVLPGGGGDDYFEVTNFMGGPPRIEEVSVQSHYESIADDVAADRENVTVKYDYEVTEDDLMNSSVLCLGAQRYNSLVDRLRIEVGDRVTILDDGFCINGIDYFGEDESLLVTVRNPYNDDCDITFYLGNSPDAIYKATFMFFYGWDSFVVYGNGLPIDRGEWNMDKGTMYFECR